jgi:Pro-kumamolisin, activation domain/Bacterial Ig-like domain (group 3)
MKISWNSKAVVVCALCLFFAQFALAQSQAPAIAPRITEAVDDAKLVTLAGNTHRMAQPQFDQGAAPDSLPLKRMMIVFKRSPEQESALRTLLDEQQDSGSPNFHKWLTPDEFGKRFGPADADIQVVKQWLEGHGFRVTDTTRGKTVLEFSGTARLVKPAFHTEIHKFMVNGEPHWSNISNPQIPAAIAPVVSAVTSLHSFFKRPAHVVLQKNVPAKKGPGPTPSLLLQGGTFALAPADWATIYNVNPVYTASVTGAGKTIAIVGRSNINLSDVTQFRSVSGLPANPPTVVLNGPDPGDLGGGEEVEALLDNEWSGAIGKGASVKFVVSESTETTDGVTLSEVYIVDNDLGDVMSESFSLCETVEDQFPDQLNLDEELAEQAAAQGITFVAATGDSGAANCDGGSETTETQGLAVGIPASTPFATGVGGTQFNENNDNNLYWNPTTGAALKYIPEDVWNESCAPGTCAQNQPPLGATGGGVSVIFSKPAYQAGVTGIPNDGARDVPDISFSAAGHDGYIVCLDGSCADPNNIEIAIVSGTSASTPSFAGVMSLVDQKTNSRQGLANIVLYHLAASETFANCNASTLEPGTPPAGSCVFNDVTVGNNSVPGETGYPNGKYAATVGYDPVTGLGSANVANLVNNWGGVVRTASTTTLSITPTSITHGQNVTASGTVTGSGGTPTGDVAFVADGTTLPGMGFETLASGNFNNTTIPDLPGGGPYNVVAKYSGDTKFAPSTSTPVSVTVTPEGSATTVSILSGTSGNPISSAPSGSLVFVRVDVAGNSGNGIPTGSVTLVDSDASDGATLVLNSFGFAELQTKSLPSGNHSFTATYSGDPSFNTSTSAAAALMITGSSGGGGSYSLSANPATMSIPSTGQAVTTVTVTGTGGFAGSVALSASIQAPAGGTASCSFTANPIALSASTTSGTSTMTCIPSAESSVGFVPTRGTHRPFWIGVSTAAALTLSLACMFLLGMPTQKRRWATAFALVVLAAATAVVGCSGGGGSGGGGGGGTPAGTYTVTVIGTSGSTTQTTTFTITVQ